LLTAISYAEMATSFPAAGAEYAYVRHAWPKVDWLAFGVGAIVLIGGAATAATVAMAFGGYLRAFVDLPAPIAALLLLAGCTAFNIWGLSESSWVNILFTSIEVVGLLLVIVAALQSNARMPVVVAAVESSIMAAAALLFFVYLGFEEIAKPSTPPNILELSSYDLFVSERALQQAICNCKFVQAIDGLRRNRRVIEQRITLHQDRHHVRFLSGKQFITHLFRQRRVRLQRLLCGDNGADRSRRNLGLLLDQLFSDCKRGKIVEPRAGRTVAAAQIEMQLGDARFLRKRQPHAVAPKAVSKIFLQCSEPIETVCL
jgi:hypothetical protein